jgi:hypothetical protein
MQPGKRSVPKKTPTQPQIELSKVVASELWDALRHLNAALAILETHKLPFKVIKGEIAEIFTKTSELHTNLRLWIEKNDRQLELPEEK